MAAPTAGWLIYPPKGELQAVAQRVVCWANHDKRIQVGTWGGTHLVIPFDLCQDIAEPLVLTPGGDEYACQDGVTPTGWTVVSNLEDGDVSGLNPNTCQEVAAPAGFAVSGTPTATAANLTWTATPGATAYVVRYREQGSTGAWTEVAASGTTAALTGLTAETTYDATVQAVVGGYLSAKATATVTTAAA